MKILKLAFFLDEAWFTSNRNIISQNNWHCCSKNRHAVDKVSLHELKSCSLVCGGCTPDHRTILFTKTDYDHCIKLIQAPLLINRRRENVWQSISFAKTKRQIFKRNYFFKTRTSVFSKKCFQKLQCLLRSQRVALQTAPM